MLRLTSVLKFPLTTFRRCQLCGHASDDICEFRMHQECDEKDEPEPNNYLVICAQGECLKVLQEHPRLYREVPWGKGSPGIFMLLCGDCQFRQITKCSHPNLKANGGSGLEIRFANPFPTLRVCFSDGTSIVNELGPATYCAGKKPIEG